MFEIRQALDAELPAILDVHRAAFETDAESRLVRALVASPAYVPELSIVAVEDERVVGHILLTRCTIENESAGDDPTPALCLAPLAVLPRRQGLGLGGVLIESAAIEARDLGECILLVLGYPEYYTRFGFEPAIPHGIAPPVEVPHDAWMVRALCPGALDGVLGVARLSPVFDDPAYW